MYSFDRDRWTQQSRTIFLRQPIDDKAANESIAQLICLDLEDSDTPIQIYINTESGLAQPQKTSVAAGLAIYDTMRSLRSEIHTICTGTADSIGSLLLAIGSPGNRLAHSHARIRLAQADEVTLTTGTAQEIESAARSVFRQRQVLYELYAQATGQSIETIAADTAKREYMSATEAQAYGSIDRIR
ncbi:ATP-dependent Clp protease proteolytic subunit [Chamaesiphon polymorphus]|uniref:ATP-dependent Clp protease proteolytic subunit n=1 Tax=Chamaesiphon polymorphus CCALA 037 TaxID=2107692 RepID=A0A2T1G264_9CYAN|nr:ATP-dependent Clp protease proteolytic subunit [Chamaesiphon polymorphus]PSB51327.1 ATP-dependent Clp protease proteolytic subunit [Chamaesiphon polymorphus CCALA 037]